MVHSIGELNFVLPRSISEDLYFGLSTPVVCNIILYYTAITVLLFHIFLGMSVANMRRCIDVTHISATKIIDRMIQKYPAICKNHDIPKNESRNTQRKIKVAIVVQR